MTETDAPSRALPAVPSGEPPPRRLRRVFSLRDIPDVEGRVTTALGQLSLPLEGERSDRLVLAGVEAIFRVERAVPRGQPLEPVLEGVLEQRLLELARSGNPEHPESHLQAA
jgi:hypothetical protein